MNQDKLERDVFRVSILFKGIYSFFELVLGVILIFVTSSAIYNFVYEIFRHELVEDPTDFIANSLLTAVGNLSSSLKLFIAIYLISHGIIKLALIISLWKEKRWAYPIAMVVFSWFIIYQSYRYLIHPSLVLLFLNDLDLAVIILTLLEWRRLRYKRGRGK
jgi:uncharacterized membrane protein